MIKNSSWNIDMRRKVKRKIPMLSESPPSVGRKLEWKPRIPITPPPTSTEFTSLRKNACLTNRHPLHSKWFYSKNLSWSQDVITAYIPTKWSKIRPLECRKYLFQWKHTMHMQTDRTMHLSAACCLSTMSSTLTASWVLLSDVSTPLWVARTLLKGIFAEKWIWTL